MHWNKISDIIYLRCGVNFIFVWKWRIKLLNLTNKNSYDEISCNLNLAKQGNSQAEGVLILMLEPLLVKYCRRFFGKFNDDLMQMGRVKILELIRRFDNSNPEVKFLGYMSKFISCFYWDLKKIELKQKAEFPMPSDEIFDENSTYFENGYDKIETADMLNALTDEQRYVIVQNIMYRNPLSKVGSELNMSGDRVKYIRNKALSKLRSSQIAIAH